MIMAESVLNIFLAVDSKNVAVPFNKNTTAEDVCICLCKQLGIGTVSRHLFALRLHGKHIFLMQSATFTEKNLLYDLRIRYKVTNIKKLKKIDIKAYDYYFHQARSDVLDNKVADLISEKYRNELIGLGTTDMYRVMLEKDLTREAVVSDYKKYLPKEVVKRHAFFVKKPIYSMLGKIKKAGHDVWYIKAEYLKQFEIMAPEYLSEEYKALTDENGSVSNVIVRVSPNHPTEPGVKYCYESRKDKWHQICTLEDLGFVSLRKDGTVEISRKNGIPFYLKFNSVPSMFSFVSLLDGYYRLTAKWTFNICKDVLTPSLQRLYAMKCHGPIGGEFSYAKLEEKRGNRPGCFILRESESKYNVFYIDVCVKDSLKPKTYKLERLSGDEFIFNDDLTRYRNIQQLMSAYSDVNGSIYLAECLPPSEYDKSPLLLCQSDSLRGDSLTDSSTVENITSTPLCINNKDLQVYRGRKCLKWNKDRSKIKHRNELRSQDKFHKSFFPDESLSYAKKFCRNPDGDLGGPWCFVDIEDSSEIEKEYCDIPFCDDSCMVFTKNDKIYTHYTHFPKTLTNFSFGLKLWDPDSFMNCSARLVLSLFALPTTGKDIHGLGTGIEIYISNSKSALRYGNVDKPDYEDTYGIIKSHEFTYFSLTWWKNIITLFKEGEKKPIFLAEYNHKNTLMGFKKNMFHYYAAQGTNVVWSLPFCDIVDECDVHTTTGSNFQQYFPLRETNVGYDLQFHLRAFHSAYILLVPSPAFAYPNIRVMIQHSDNFTRVLSTEYEGGSTTVLKELALKKIISYWKWQEFNLGIFVDELELYVTKETGTFSIFKVKHNMVKQIRWYSPSSEHSVAHWTFYCYPPKESMPTAPWLPECVLNQKESAYNGTQAVTSEGLACLPWSGKKLLPAVVENLFNGNDLNEAFNYCRDPKNEQNGTYCYTISEDKENRINKEYCHVRKCKSTECRMAGTGNDYVGRVSTTRSNRTCQHWMNPLQTQNQTNSTESSNMTGNYKLTGEYDNINFFQPMRRKRQIEDRGKAKLLNNVLKFNDLSDKTGCTDKCTPLRNVRDVVKNNNPKTKQSDDFDSFFETTNATGIEHAAELARLISESKAKTNETVTDDGIHKFEYVEVHKVKEEYLNDTLYADLEVIKAENFCRNPSRNIAGCWCYTLDPDVPRDLCNIRDCDKPEEYTIITVGHGGGQKKEGSENITVVYRGMWRHTKGKKIEVAMKILKQDCREKYLQDFLDLAGQWAFLRSSAVVKLYGITLSSQLSMVLEYVRLGPLDQYLRTNKANIKIVDLIEASSNLASALWHLEENGIIHGNIRCRKLLVSYRDENSFIVKLTDPGIHSSYASKEVHWIPIECYSNLEFAKRSTPADVWAFATTLWEIFMFGEAIKHVDHIEAMKFYSSGKRLPPPPQCPSDIYQLIRECWDYDPHRRKQPQAIMRDINQILYGVYNSRRVHSYAKLSKSDSQNLEETSPSISAHSGATEKTFLPDELLSVSAMSEVDDDLSIPNNFMRGWKSQDIINNDDALSCDFSTILSAFSFSTATTSMDSINSIQSIFELDDNCNVVLQGIIGKGFYGDVYKGILEYIDDKSSDPRRVAVKKLKKTAAPSCLQDFEREISIMKTLKHPNIVEILGVLQEPEISLVMEYVQHGSLQSYLKINRESLSVKQLLKYALDISVGMEYLGKKNIVHRDLAARNILVVDENHVKISDFGLAQVMGTNDYYVLKTNRELPFKWYAPESLQEGKFSPRSDVWSFGVTMCEMFSYGEEPKLAVMNDKKVEGQEQQILLAALQSGARFPCPSMCPQAVYVSIIYPCWEHNPHARPTFLKLCGDIKEADMQTD